MSNLENQASGSVNRFFLRFIFLYLILYIYPYGFEYIQELKPDDISFWQGITIWFGDTTLGWEMNADRLMKGFDSMYDYSRFLLIAVLAILGAVIWMFVDRRLKKDYDGKLNTLLRTILRYHVGMTLIIYGLAKVFMLQFGEMDLIRLESTTGSTNGMGFLWWFMSYSKFYTMTTGWIELIGGVLLLFRRTTFTGSFILFISMVTVVLIDIGYDVRVKMFAIHLLGMTILLLSPDFKRLLNFFIFNKAAAPAIEPRLFTGKKWPKIGYGLKGALLLYFLVSSYFIYTERIHNQTYNRYESLTRFHTVELQVVNGDTIPENDAQRWKSIAINGSSYRAESLQIKMGQNPYHKYYSFTADTIQQTITFEPLRGENKEVYTMQYDTLGNKEFVFEGTSTLGDTLWIKTSAKSLDDYPLYANKIRWITDYKKKE